MFALLSVVATLLFLVYCYLLAKSRPKNFPPGPPRLPVWGSYWFMLLKNYQYSHKALDAISRQYGSKVIGLYLGSLPTIVACDYKSVHELLTRPEFNSRPEMFAAKTFTRGKMNGVFFSEDKFWVEQRRFTLRFLRDRGFARRMQSYEDVVREELGDMLAVLRGVKHPQDIELVRGDTVLIPKLFNPGLTNSLLSVMTGERFAPGSWQPIYECAKASEQFLAMDPTGGALGITPWLRHFGPRAFGWDILSNGSATLAKFVKAALQQQRETFSDDQLRGFFDLFLKVVHDHTGQDSSFSEDQLLQLGIDLMLPIGQAVPHMLAFTILLLIENPQVQTKLQAEIDDVVGRARLPSLDDRPSLHYVEATLREAQRRQTLVPLSLARRALEDTHLGGYFVPKGSFMAANLWSVHMDPDVWGDPEAFRPERFLDEDGKLIRKDMTLPFGGGRRVCAGETFTRHLLFLFLTGLVQNFTFSSPPGEKLPSMDDLTIPGLSLGLTDVWLKFAPRA